MRQSLTKANPSWLCVYFLISDRMGFLVKKWRRATRVGAPAVSQSLATQQGLHTTSEYFTKLTVDIKLVF